MSDQKKKVPVGSRSRKGIKAEMVVPVNLERVLIEAGKDQAFYQALRVDRGRALAERGFQLRTTEQAMLSAMPWQALEKTIERLRPETLKKSRFAKRVASAIAGTVLFSTAACSDDSAGDNLKGGTAPDGWLQDTTAEASTSDSASVGDASVSQGISPDWPADASRDSGQAGTGGIPPIGGSGGGGVGPDWPNDASFDGSQAGTGDAAAWQPDSGMVTGGIAPDLPDGAVNDSSTTNKEGGN
jgi:hypothetical protein